MLMPNRSSKSSASYHFRSACTMLLWQCRIRYSHFPVMVYLQEFFLREERQAYGVGDQDPKPIEGDVPDGIEAVQGRELGNLSRRIQIIQELVNHACPISLHKSRIGVDAQKQHEHCQYLGSDC